MPLIQERKEIIKKAEVKETPLPIKAEVVENGMEEGTQKGPLMDYNALQGDVFVGKVLTSEIIEGTDRRTGEPKKFWQITVETSFAPNFRIKAPYSERKRSLYGCLLKGFNDAGIKLRTPEDIVGLVVEFEREEIDFGGDIKVKDYPIPKRILKVEVTKQIGVTL